MEMRVEAGQDAAFSSKQVAVQILCPQEGPEALKRKRIFSGLDTSETPALPVPATSFLVQRPVKPC